jgi:hypothetical protein
VTVGSVTRTCNKAGFTTRIDDVDGDIAAMGTSPDILTIDMIVNQTLSRRLISRKDGGPAPAAFFFARTIHFEPFRQKPLMPD